MNIQPHSSSLRKYIPQEKYFRLMEEQRKRSLLDFPLDSIEEKRIVQRIEELEKLEETGFVFVGEKNWLQSYLIENKSPQLQNYVQWVRYNFTNFMKLKFEISQDFDHLDYIIWQAEFDGTDLTLGFDELKNPSFLEIDELEIFIGGNEQSPHPDYLIKAFEFLHNLEYAVSTLSYKPPGGREISVTGIDVSNPDDPCRWELNVISDYGSEWDFTILNGKAWQP